MVKKILLCFSILLFGSISYAKTYDFSFLDYAPNHVDCVSKRWQHVCTDGGNEWFYDTKTIEFKNRYNPFEDSIVVLWALNHWGNHRYNDDKYRYEINIDERTYKCLNVKKHSIRPIEPDSHMEMFWQLAKKKY